MRYLILALVVFNFFFFVQINPTLQDPDAFYHLKMAELIQDQGVILDFPWQQQTVLQDYFTDHHLLYHLYIIPFISVFGSLLGIKIAQTLLNVGLFLLIYFILKKFKVKYAEILMVFLLTMPYLTARLSLLKGSPLALILVLAGFYFLTQKKYLWLWIIAFLYVWSHGGFIVLLAITFIYTLFYKKEFIKANLTAWAGVLAGLVINPYFPQNLKFYWQQLVQIGLINYKDEIAVGSEWYSPNLFSFIPPNGTIFIFITLALVCLLIYRKKLTRLHWLLLSLAGFFFLATLKSVRFVEYFIPFAFIFSCLTLTLYLTSNHFKKQLVYYRKNIYKHKIYLVIGIYLSIALILFFLANLQTLYFQFQENNNNKYYYSYHAQQHLKAVSQPGDTVFHSRWDYWPQFFYHNTYNNFLVGLDPTFMYNYNKDNYQTWIDLRDGKFKTQSAQVIKQTFNCKYALITDQQFDQLLLAYLKRDPKAQLIYQDEQINIFDLTSISVGL